MTRSSFTESSIAVMPILPREREQIMISLSPEFLIKDGKKEFVVLTYDEFEALQDYLETMEDLLDLRKAKQEEAGNPVISLEEAKEQLDLL